MTILIDNAHWPNHGRYWCHLVSDLSLAELHAFAARLGIPERGFGGDHYDLPDEMRAARGTLTEPGRNSPFRDRSVAENLDLFRRMRKGEFPNGARVLRAKHDAGAEFAVTDMVLRASDYVGLVERADLLARRVDAALDLDGVFQLGQRFRLGPDDPGGQAPGHHSPRERMAAEWMATLASFIR